MLSQPTTAETAAPTTMASISPAGTPSKAASALLRRPAPRSRGWPSMKENRAACSRENPSAIAAEMVTPERDPPGTSETA